MGPGLHTTTVGEGPRLVLVSGFTQTSACWAPVATDLSQDHEVMTVDPPGHGGSSRVQLDLWPGADALGSSAGAGTYLGYSMGGRFCLHLALTRPDLVHRLVLVGATAGLRTEAERAARRADDEALAQRLEGQGVERFVDEWLEHPLFAGLTPETDCRAARHTNAVEGLASSLRLASTGAQDDLWPRLAELTMPVLIVAGELDHKFTAIGASMVEHVGTNAHLAIVKGAHHAAPFERPAAFTPLIRRWLDATS